MKLKRGISMLLISVMMAGTIGTLDATPAYAAGETNTFTLTVPADTNITKSGWNDIGAVKVSDVSLKPRMKITVGVAEGPIRTLKNTEDPTQTVEYEVREGTSASSDVFSPIDFTTNGSHTLGAVVADFSSAPAGTYEDTIYFVARLRPVETVVADAFILGSQFKLEITYNTAQYAENFSFTCKKTTNGFEVVEILSNGYNVTDFMKTLCSSRQDGTKIIFELDNTLTFTVNTDINKYSFSVPGTAQITFNCFSVMPADTTEFRDIMLTPA